MTDEQRTKIGQAWESWNLANVYQNSRSAFFAGAQFTLTEQRADATFNKLHPEKPPVGVKPLHVHELQRVHNLILACARYIDAAKQMPRDWLLELRELIRPDRSPRY